VIEKMGQAVAPIPEPQPEQFPALASCPLNPFARALCRVLFPNVRLDALSAESIRRVASGGSLIYVMRQRSWVDYLLVTYVLFREGLPIPEFANDLWAVWLRPFPVLARAIWRRLLDAVPRRRKLRDFEERDRCQRMVSAGRTVLLFMRGRTPRVGFFAGRRRALIGTRTGRDYLREIVHHLWASERELSLVPIAVFRGRGMRRKEERPRTVVYTVQEMQTDLRRLMAYLWNRRDTNIRVGGEVRLRDFMRQYQSEGEERLLRRLTRALLIYLYREERLVWGPPLLAKRQVRERVLQSAEVQGLVKRLAVERRQAESQVWRQAGRYFDEMAANYNSFYFSILELVFKRIWPRVFQGLEYSGLEKVAERVKQNPVVLVPCHRSHFDYLILSYIFHINYLSPPHIAAGINLSFWPLGPLFRGAGAYFIRRSFADNELYKAVFAHYLTFLIREGYTQEFFIEGGRSRTGKIQTPKLGMLSAIVEAFVGGVRRDLYLVPVSIQYGRVVEEDAYQHELGGGKKEVESLRALVQARQVFRQRHGTAYVRFAEPISLNDALGSRKELFRHTSGPELETEKRRFTRKLGFQLLREVNKVAVAGATSVTATVLLSLPHPACPHHEFVTRALAVVRFLRRLGVEFSTSLLRNVEGEFRESLSFLGGGGLIRTMPCGNEIVVHVPTEKRVALDFYKNNTLHFFLLAALLIEGLGRGLRGSELDEDAAWWLHLFRWEFPLPERDQLVGEFDRLRQDLRAEGVLVGNDGEETLAKDHPFVDTARGMLDNFRESYWVAAKVLMSLPEEGLPRGAVLERMQARYETGLLLGEVAKPEGNSRVTLGNTLSRFAEIDCIKIETADKAKDSMIQRGACFGDLLPVAERIRASLGSVQCG
jgi:glycerol-3-phosphate O-acyltransferase